MSFAPSPSSDRPIRVILDQGRLARWGYRLPWLLFFVALFFAFKNYSAYQQYMQTNPRLEERYVSHSKTAQQKIAIITVEGTILHSDGFAKWQIDQVRDDPDVKAVVLRVDSPGGTVTGSDYLYHHLKLLREEKKIPLVVSMGGIAASGGYYISMAAGNEPDTIFAERTSWTGSIGVIIPHYNAGELLANWNIIDDSVTSGPLKAMGSPTRKLTPKMAEEEHHVLQELVDQTFADFKNIVTEARPQLAANPDKLAAATTGQVFTAKQALDLGLVDKLGYIEEAVDRAIDLAGLGQDQVRVVKYQQREGLLGGALFGSSASALQKPADAATSLASLNLETIADLATPRAYYLFTSLPALLSNQPIEPSTALLSLTPPSAFRTPPLPPLPFLRQLRQNLPQNPIAIHVLRLGLEIHDHAMPQCR